MPANIPFLSDTLLAYINKVNAWRMTRAEEFTENVTKDLSNDKMIPVLGAMQHVSVMGISAAQANFLALLTRLLSAPFKPMRAIDVGTFTGRAALAIAQAMPHGGEVIACENNSEFAEVARTCWQQAGEEINSRITLALGDANETLDKQLENGTGTFDIIFIDANKDGYPSYYEKALKLLRSGGIVVLDNMLWSGTVADPAYYQPNGGSYDESAAILRELNENIAKDPEVDATLLSFEDGVMVVQKHTQEQHKAVILFDEQHKAAQERYMDMLKHLRETTKD